MKAAALIALGAMAGVLVLAGLGWFACVLAVAANDLARENDPDWPESVHPSPAMRRREGGSRMSTANDPATLAEYEAKFAKNQRITGYGADVVTHFPCPACAAPDWLAFPITAALNDYADVQEPNICSACGRGFRMVITVEGGGPFAGGSTRAAIVQTGGPGIPAYLPSMERLPQRHRCRTAGTGYREEGRESE